jgi:uncharacterized protein (TIGR03437 family)
MNFVRVYVQNEPMPMLYVSEGQVNFIMSTLVLVGPVNIRMATESNAGPEITVTLVDCAPALFPIGAGYAIATTADNKLLTTDAPAHPGDTIVIYITGLGRTSPNPAPGEIPTYAAQIVTPSALKVTFGTMAIDPSLIKYAGLTPGSGGLYQINVFVPQGVGTDPEIKVVGNTTSGGLKLPIR